MYGHGRNMRSGLDGLTPEEILALGIRKGLDMVRQLGREGDTEIVHVNQQEKQALLDMGGRGSINPATGLHEYPPGSGRGGQAGRDRDAAGRGDRDDRDTGPGRRGARESTRDIGQIGDMEANRGSTTQGGSTGGVRGGGNDGVTGNPSSVGGAAGPGPTGDAAAAEDTRSFGDRVMDGLAAAFGGPSLGPPTSKDPGFLGAAASLAPGFGLVMGGVRGLQAMGIPGREVEEGELGTDAYSGTRDGDILSPPRQRPQQQQPNQTPRFDWQRPNAMPITPGGLGFDAGMTPLQLRTNLAAGATQGNRGIFRDPAVMDFYRQLATFSLTDPSGAPLVGQAPTPIELQFLTQLGAQPGDTTESFLKALAGLQF